jgi:hypothetical protein
MEIAKSLRVWNLKAQKRPVQTKLDENGTESACARAMAEAERVLREISLPALCAGQPNPGHSSFADEKPKAQSLVSPRSGGISAAPPAVERLRLDPDLDFIVHDHGVIELTEAGFRRMVQAHSSGRDAVIEVDRREVLRFPAPKLGYDSGAAERRHAIHGSPRCADLIEVHIRRAQSLAELLQAEESSEVAMDMINKERERQEIESLLPWHAAGTLSRGDADRVERALADDRELAQRYELVREELAETIHLNEALGAPSARAMEKLFAAIDAEDAHAPCPQRRRISGTSALATASP